MWQSNAVARTPPGPGPPCVTSRWEAAMPDPVLRFVLRYPGTVVVLSLAFVLGLGFNLPDLKIDPDIKNMLPQDYPAMVNLDSFEDTFAASELVLVAVDVDDILDRGALEELHSFNEQLEQLVDAYKVVSVFSVKHLQSDEKSFTPVDLIDIDELPETETQKAELTKRLSDDMYVGNLISKDLKSLAFLVLPEDEFNDRRLAEEVTALAKSHLGERARVTGLPSTRAEVMDGMRADLKTFLPIGIVLMILLLVLSFRTWLGAILPLLVVILSIVSTLGLTALMGEKLTMVSLIMPVMLIAVANDYGIHLVAHYLGRVSKEPAVHRKIHIYKVGRSLGIPIVAAGLTTVAGFLTLLTHVIPSARSTGLLSAFGVVVAFVLSLTFVPAMLVLLRPPPQVVKSYGLGLIPKLLTAFSAYLQRHGGKTVLAMLALGLVAMTGLPKLNVDTDPVHYFHQTSPVRQANEYVNEVFGGSAQLNVVVEGDIKDPGVLARMRALQAHLESLTMVSQTQSVADTVVRMNRAFHGDDLLFERVPESRDLVAQYLLLYSFQADLSDFDHFVDFEYKTAQVAARVNSTSSSALEELIRKTEGYLDANTDRTEFTMVTGFVTVLGTLVNMIVRGQIISLAVSLLLVFLISAVLFRSVLGGLFVSLPLVFVLLVVFGLMGHFEIELNVATAMLSSIMIGVGVDYIIHFMWHYRSHLRQSGDPWVAVDRTIQTSGRGIIVNALSVVIGFSVLLASNFMPVFFFGFLLTISITNCLLAALLILPVLAARFRPKFLERPAQAQDSKRPVDEAELIGSGESRTVGILTRMLGLVIAASAAYLVYSGVVIVWNWYLDLPVETGFWVGLWALMSDNSSIFLAIYCIICLNSAGIAEFKFRRPFVWAFLLAVPLTPPLMIAAWARRGATGASRPR